MTETKKVSEGVITNVIALIISLLASLLSIKLIEDESLVFSIILGLIFALTALGIGVYLHAGASNLLMARRLHKQDEEDAVLPSLVKFLRRRDVFVVDRDNSVKILWDFELESRPGANISELFFPVYVDSDAKESQVRVDELSINDVAFEVDDVYKQRQLIRLLPRENGDRSIEYGVAKVPVSLSDGNSRCRVHIKLELKNAFREMAKGEFCIVDIPYPTEVLQVEVRPAEGSNLVIHKADGPHEAVIEAEQAQMLAFDLAETTRQQHKSSRKNKALRWNTRYPMLGYRYRIWFKATDKPMVEPKEPNRAASEARAT